MLNPIYHGATKPEIDVYKVEPYVMAADIYGVAPHIGRGGWTWYTGSAGWMYRLIIETLWASRAKAKRWCSTRESHSPGTPSRSATRFRETPYRIVFERTSGAPSLSLDNKPQPDPERFTLIDDGQEHQVVVNLATPKRESTLAHQTRCRACSPTINSRRTPRVNGRLFTGPRENHFPLIC